MGRVTAVVLGELGIRALAKCRAAACFEAGAPRLDAETARLQYGAVPRDLFVELERRGLIDFTACGPRLTAAGEAALDAVKDSNTPGYRAPHSNPISRRRRTR